LFFFQVTEEARIFQEPEKRTNQEEGLAPAEEGEIKLWIQYSKTFAMDFAS